MQCKGCNQDFPNIGALNKHKKECVALKVVAADDSSNLVVKEDGPVVLPWRVCDETLKVFEGSEALVTLTVNGKVVKDGIEVVDVFYRRR